jgi:hypothetical protein
MSVEMNTAGMETAEPIGVSRNYHLLENEITIKLKQGIHINNIISILWEDNRPLK